jgi:hypothetical protein
MHMLDWLRRLAARFLAIGLLAATLFAVDSLASPSPAEARCIGVNNPVTSWFAWDGAKRVSETPGAGTCNENNIYSGVLKDESADGYCVSVEFQETGISWTRAPGGYTCGATSTFQWNDSNNNSYVYQRFVLLRGRPRSVTSQATELHKCKIGITPFDCPRDNRSSDGGRVACGWGDSNGGYAANSGY